MPLNLDSNPASYFQQGPYPGQANFYEALKYYMGDLLGPGGKGPGQLAQAGATDRAAGGYYGDMPLFDPGSGAAQAGAQGAFGNLLTGESAARNAAMAATAQNQQKDAGGIANVASAYGSDIGNTLGTQQAWQAAQPPSYMDRVNNYAGSLGGLGVGMARGSGMGSGGSSSSASAPSIPNLPSGFSTSPTGYDPSALPSWLKPSDISAYGPSMDSGSSFLSMLQGLGGWF